MVVTPPPRASDEARLLAQTLVEALVHCRTDDAQAIYDELCDIEPRTRDLLVFPLVLALQQNTLPAFYRSLLEKGEDHAPEIQALCLCYMNDPTWQGLAERLKDEHPDPVARRSMRYMLGDYDTV